MLMNFPGFNIEPTPVAAPTGPVSQQIVLDASQYEALTNRGLVSPLEARSHRSAARIVAWIAGAGALVVIGAVTVLVARRVGVDVGASLQDENLTIRVAESVQQTLFVD